MAAILLSACTINSRSVDGLKIVKIKTPATADGQDTIDVSSLFTTGCFSFTSGATDNSEMCGSSYVGMVVKLGGTTADETRTVILVGE